MSFRGSTARCRPGKPPRRLVFVAQPSVPLVTPRDHLRVGEYHIVPIVMGGMRVPGVVADMIGYRSAVPFHSYSKLDTEVTASEVP
jgi:hypothetical protein